MNSSSDRRVLDEEDPDPNQTARDRQSQHKQPGNDPLEAQAVRSPAVMLSSGRAFSFKARPTTGLLITFNSIHSVIFNRNAHRRPARLAFQLEAQPDHFTILSDVFATLNNQKFDTHLWRLVSPHDKPMLSMSGTKSGDN